MNDRKRTGAQIGANVMRDVEHARMLIENDPRLDDTAQRWKEDILEPLDEAELLIQRALYNAKDLLPAQDLTHQIGATTKSQQEDLDWISKRASDAVIAMKKTLEGRRRALNGEKTKLPDGHKVVRTWPSESRRNVVYEIVEAPNGEVWCTCPAWRYTQKRPRECKHMLAWAESVALGGAHLVKP